eukprot:TRINITY_DN5_c0_g1_i10.p6 TRINITY_DN5_c0_g1~~TRINITY_DN5_c0_g1_i10.p6  ORF type:complete len:136 (+),score=8.84 TRINITY_DN5_c0_g1_i10:1065-1472(+)
MGGRALLRLGGHPDLPTLCKLRIPMRTIRETHGGCQRPSWRGKQPRPPAKVPKYCQVGNDVGRLRQLGGWLRSSHPLKKAQQLTSRVGLRGRCNGAKQYTEAAAARLRAGQGSVVQVVEGGSRGLLDISQVRMLT